MSLVCSLPVSWHHKSNFHFISSQYRDERMNINNNSEKIDLGYVSTFVHAELVLCCLQQRKSPTFMCLNLSIENFFHFHSPEREKSDLCYLLRECHVMCTLQTRQLNPSIVPFLQLPFFSAIFLLFVLISIAVHLQQKMECCCCCGRQFRRTERQKKKIEKIFQTFSVCSVVHVRNSKYGQLTGLLAFN